MLSSDYSNRNIFIDMFHQKKEQLFTFISSFSNTSTLSIIVPKNTYLRTKIICEYIEDQYEVDFQPINFIMLMYLEFLQQSIENYQPHRIREEIYHAENHDDYLIIHDKGKTFKTKTNHEKRLEIKITMSKRDVEKGMLLLEEIESLHGHSPSLEQMIAALWINYINEYKSGNKQYAIDKIVALVMRSF